MVSSSSSSPSPSLLEINAHGLLIVSTNFTFVGADGNNDDLFDCRNNKNHLSFLLTVEDASLKDACPTNHTATANSNNNNDNVDNQEFQLFQTQEAMTILPNAACCHTKPTSTTASTTSTTSTVITKTILIPLCRRPLMMASTSSSSLPITDEDDDVINTQTRSLLVTLWQGTSRNSGMGGMGGMTNSDNDATIQHYSPNKKPLTRRLVTLPKMMMTSTITTTSMNDDDVAANDKNYYDTNQHHHHGNRRLLSPIATLELDAIVSMMDHDSYDYEYSIPILEDPITTTNTIRTHNTNKSSAITFWDLVAILVPLWFSQKRRRHQRSSSNSRPITRQHPIISIQNDNDYYEEESSIVSNPSNNIHHHYLPIMETDQNYQDQEEEDSVSLEESSFSARRIRSNRRDQNDNESSSSSSQEQQLLLLPRLPQRLDDEFVQEEAIDGTAVQEHDYDEEEEEDSFRGDPLEVLRLVQEMLDTTTNNNSTTATAAAAPFGDAGQQDGGDLVQDLQVLEPPPAIMGGVMNGGGIMQNCSQEQQQQQQQETTTTTTTTTTMTTKTTRTERTARFQGSNSSPTVMMMIDPPIMPMVMEQEPTATERGRLMIAAAADEPPHDDDATRLLFLPQEAKEEAMEEPSGVGVSNINNNNQIHINDDDSTTRLQGSPMLEETKVVEEDAEEDEEEKEGTEQPSAGTSSTRHPMDVAITLPGSPSEEDPTTTVTRGAERVAAATTTTTTTAFACLQGTPVIPTIMDTAGTPTTTTIAAELGCLGNKSLPKNSNGDDSQQLFLLLPHQQAADKEEELLEEAPAVIYKAHTTMPLPESRGEETSVAFGADDNDDALSNCDFGSGNNDHESELVSQMPTTTMSEVVEESIISSTDVRTDAEHTNDDPTSSQSALPSAKPPQAAIPQGHSSVNHHHEEPPNTSVCLEENLEEKREEEDPTGVSLEAEEQSVDRAELLMNHDDPSLEVANDDVSESSSMKEAFAANDDVATSLGDPHSESNEVSLSRPTKKRRVDAISQPMNPQEEPVKTNEDESEQEEHPVKQPKVLVESSPKNFIVHQQVETAGPSDNAIGVALQDCPTTEELSKDGDLADDTGGTQDASGEALEASTDPFDATFEHDDDDDDDKSAATVSNSNTKKETTNDDMVPSPPFNTWGTDDDVLPTSKTGEANDLSQASVEVIDVTFAPDEETVVGEEGISISLGQPTCPSQNSLAPSQEVVSANAKKVDGPDQEPKETKVAPGTANDSPSPAEERPNINSEVEGESKQTAIDTKVSKTARDDNESYVSTLPPDSDYNSIADVAWHSRRQRREEQSRASDVSVLTSPDMKITTEVDHPNESNPLTQASVDNEAPLPSTTRTTRSKSTISSKSRPKMEKLLSRKRYRETEVPTSPEITIIENLSSLPKKPRPFRNSNIVPDWVPSNGLQNASSQFASEDYSWDKPKRSATTKQVPAAGVARKSTSSMPNRGGDRISSISRRTSSSSSHGKKERVRSRRKSHGGNTSTNTSCSGSVQKKK